MNITDLPGMKAGSTIRNIAVGAVYAFVLLMVIGAMAPAEDTDNSGASEAEAETEATDAPDDTETAKADGGTETEQPAEETETEAPEGESGDSGSSGDGYQVRVSYDGEWSGSFGSMGESRTVDGTGAKTIDIDMDDEMLNMVSATVQKLEAGDGEMTVEILNDGEVVEEKSTSAEHGVVTISYET